MTETTHRFPSTAWQLSPCCTWKLDRRRSPPSCRELWERKSPLPPASLCRYRSRRNAYWWRNSGCETGPCQKTKPHKTKPSLLHSLTFNRPYISQWILVLYISFTLFAHVFPSFLLSLLPSFCCFFLFLNYYLPEPLSKRINVYYYTQCP